MANQYMLSEKTPSDGPGYTFFVCISKNESLTINAVATKKEGYGMGHPLTVFAYEFARRGIRTWTITNTSDNSKVGELTYDGSTVKYDSSAVKLSLES